MAGPKYQYEMVVKTFDVKMSAMDIASADLEKHLANFLTQFLSLKQMKDLLTTGWEIASHDVLTLLIRRPIDDESKT